MQGLLSITGRLALTLGVCYALLCALLFLVQRKLIYPAPKEPVRPAFGELVRVGTTDAGPVFGAWVAPPEGAPVVVHFHGNAEMLAWQEELAEDCARSGFGLLALEFPGYGLMAEQPISEARIVTAAQAGVDWLRARGVPPERTILMGRSLGTGPAVELARRGEGARLVLVTPYTSLVDMARTAFPFVPARMLLRDRFDNAAKAAGVSMPVLLVHGARDEIIPHHMSEQLADAFPDARLRTVEDTGHNDLRLGLLWDEIVAFCGGE